MNALEQVAAAIRRADRLLIACHVDPDPDCVGSMLAMHWLCARLGKVSIPLSHDPMLPQWAFMPAIDRVIRPDALPAREGWDALVVLDCELERTGDVAALAPHVRDVITIDHHVTNETSTGVCLIRPGAAATGELVYDLIGHFQLEVDADAAVLLYAALMADTGSFRYSNTSAKALEIAAHLVRAGASPAEIASAVYDTRSLAYLRLLGRVLQTLGSSDDGRVVWVSLTQRMIAEAGARDNETEGFVQYPRMIDGAEVAIFFRELPTGEVRVSLRSRQWVDVSRLAASLGGGGHPRAAGCTLQGPRDQAEAQVIALAIQAVNDDGGAPRP